MHKKKPLLSLCLTRVRNHPTILPHNQTIDQNTMHREPTADWKNSLKNSITSLNELSELLNIERQHINADENATTNFPLRVSREYISRIDSANPNDPLLLQILPQAQELNNAPNYYHDPVGDLAANPLPGLLHKYHGRVLLITSGGCAINCRYCFRRHFSYADNIPGKQGWSAILNYIAADSTIEEVIFSGGDPLIINDKELQVLIEDLENIAHVSRIRIHTRLPIIIPSRITPNLVSILANTRLDSSIVIHCNHPNEIDTSVSQALKLFQSTKTALLNQSVLLKNINNHAETLIQLNKKLFSCGVLPYYLHILDKVSGAQHFDVNEKEALELMQQLRIKLPGYLVPKLVREDSGAPYKTAIS